MIRVKIIRIDFCCYYAYVNKTSDDLMWDLVTITLTRWGAKRAIYKYLYQKGNVVEKYTLG